MKRFRFPFVAAVALCMTMSIVGSAIALTINVPADQPTIQAGINAASPGDMVVVAAGTYVENLTLSKSITLRGAQAGVPACNRVATETIVQPAAPASPVLLINNALAAGAIVDGFTFDGIGGSPVNGCVDQEAANTPGLRIQFNRIINFKTSGLWFNRSDVDGVIDNNSINGSAMVGSGQLLFMNGPQSYNGIQITNNCFINSINYGWFVDGARNVGVGAAPALISGNTFKNNGTGANTGSQSLLSATISNNTFEANVGTGWQGGPKLCSISGNLFKNNGGSGLALTSFGSTNVLRGAQNCTITGNTFTGNGTEGLFFSSGQAAGTISTNPANNNDFLGTSVGARYNGTETINVGCNWWGDINGPNYAPANPNAAGSQLIGTNMTFSPWLNGSITGAPLCNQTPDKVQAVTTGLCISPAHPCVTVPVTFTRVNTTSARGISVTFTINTAKLALCSTPAASILQGTWLSGFTTSYQVIDNGGGSYTVDQAILGLPCGTTTGGQLFTVALTNSDGDGTGTITVTSVLARDCNNLPIPGGPGSPANIPIQITAPTAISDLASTQVVTGNGAGSTGGIRLTWATGGAGTVRIYRAPFGVYPEYDDDGPVSPPNPALAPGGPWALVATGVTSPYVDATAARGFWYHVAIITDFCDNVSAVSNMTVGRLNYLLGDVTPPPGSGDNKVDGLDISLLGFNYGLTGEGPVDAVGYLDVGPTLTGAANARPTPDDNINFEDLIIFAINYGPTGIQIPQTGPQSARLGGTPSAIDALSLEAPNRVQPGQTFAVSLRLKGAGDLQGISTQLSWDPTVAEPGRVDAGSWLGSQNGIALSAAPGNVDVALMGAGQGLSGDGVLATVTFRALAAGDPRVAIARADARDASNHKVDLASQRPVVPATTEFAPVTPNPFDQTANLTFSLSRSGDVDLAIYSVDGRRVKTLAAGQHEASIYRLVWDGTDDGGHTVKAGLYFARLVTPVGRFTRRLMMVK